jgi:hypothetical protein
MQETLPDICQAARREYRKPFLTADHMDKEEFETVLFRVFRGCLKN